MLYGAQEKGITRPYDIRENAHLTDSMGPANYKVDYQDTGAMGPQWSVGIRHMEGVNAGHPNPRVQPVDTHGQWSNKAPKLMSLYYTSLQTVLPNQMLKYYHMCHWMYSQNYFTKHFLQKVIFFDQIIYFVQDLRLQVQTIDLTLNTGDVVQRNLLVLEGPVKKQMDQVRKIMAFRVNFVVKSVKYRDVYIEASHETIWYSLRNCGVGKRNKKLSYRMPNTNVKTGICLGFGNSFPKYMYIYSFLQGTKWYIHTKSI